MTTPKNTFVDATYLAEKRKSVKTTLAETRQKISFNSCR